MVAAVDDDDADDESSRLGCGGDTDRVNEDVGRCISANIGDWYVALTTADFCGGV